jgi:hypothetical protein
MLVFFIAILAVLRPFGVFHPHLVYIFCGHLLIYSHFGMVQREKSGNPEPHFIAILWLSLAQQKWLHIYTQS